MVPLVYHTSGPLMLPSLCIFDNHKRIFSELLVSVSQSISMCLKRQSWEWWQREAGVSCRPDLLLLLVFGMLGFPDSITPVTTAIIYEAGKCISDSGDQQLARSQHTARLLLCPLILQPFTPLFFLSSHPLLVWQNSAWTVYFFCCLEVLFSCLKRIGNALT